MTTPRIEIDLTKIRDNSRVLVERLGRRGIGVTGVTKAVCGCPDIARAMLDGGVTGLADARIENVERMRRSGIRVPISLIRTPMLSQITRITHACTTSYNSEMDAIHMLASSALRANTVHGVILMVEMGDLREGIMPRDLDDIARKTMNVPGIALKGIGANFACLNGQPPEQREMAELSSLAKRIEAGFGISLETVSGGNSANLPWAFGGVNSHRINDLRLGEAILLGVEPVSGVPIDGLHTDAFTVVAEVIESKMKPARGERGAAEHKNGQVSEFAARKQIRQSILAIGCQDTDVDGLSLVMGGTPIGATSDHLVVDTGDGVLEIGAEISLQPSYGALMRVMNAPSVEKSFQRQEVRIHKFLTAR